MRTDLAASRAIHLASCWIVLGASTYSEVQGSQVHEVGAETIDACLRYHV